MQLVQQQEGTSARLGNGARSSVGQWLPRGPEPAEGGRGLIFSGLRRFTGRCLARGSRHSLLHRSPTDRASTPTTTACSSRPCERPSPTALNSPDSYQTSKPPKPPPCTTPRAVDIAVTARHASRVTTSAHEHASSAPLPPSGAQRHLRSRRTAALRLFAPSSQSR